MAVQYEASVPQAAHQQTQQQYEQTVSSGGISYLEAGRPDAAPIVFLHGIGGAARMFRAQLDHFGASHRAVAWDMPGYGNSTPLPLVSIDALAAALAGFTEELGLDRPVLVGHSLGGMILPAPADHGAAHRPRRGAGADQRRFRQPRPGLAGGVPVGTARTAGRRPQHGGAGASDGG